MEMEEWKRQAGRHAGRYGAGEGEREREKGSGMGRVSIAKSVNGKRNRGQITHYYQTRPNQTRSDYTVVVLYRTVSHRTVVP